jgi:hypothetical protein
MDSLSSAPRFDLTALVSLKRISAASCAGTPLVLLFHNQYALDVVRSLQQSLRERHPLASQVLIASVVDMSAIPLLLRGVAETVMAAAYREASRQLPKGVDPADYVIILPDRQGSVYKQFEVRDGGKAPTVVVIDGQWRICGRYSNADLVAQSLGALARLITTPPN